jgi:drug/metabolite transporter (DMT)-like permease
MREQTVFVTCLIVVVLSGTVLFSQGTYGGSSWLDIVFLVASAICLTIAVVFLSRRLKKLGNELDQQQQQLRQ